MEDRVLLAASTFCFLLGFAHTMFVLGRGRYQPSRFNFAAMACGFAFQTGFLVVRGHALNACPLTNLFEVLIFLSWSMVLLYFVVGDRLPALAPRRLHLAAGVHLSGVRPHRPARQPSRPPGPRDRPALARDPRRHLHRRLRRLRPRLRRGRHVPHPGAPVEDPPLPRPLLPSPAHCRSRRRHQSPHPHRLHPPHPRPAQRLRGPVE